MRRPTASVLEETLRQQAQELDTLRREVQRLTRKHAESGFLRDEVKRLRKQVAEAESHLELALGLPERVDTYKIKPTVSARVGEASAVMVASDWHIEERVDPASVNRLNSYNLEESQRRANLFFVNGLKLVRVHQQAIAIPSMVVPIIGDMITGAIHPDAAVSNLLPPVLAIERCADYLCSGLEYLLVETKQEGMTFTIPLHSGNHGRITPKQYIQSEYGYSLETLLHAIVVRNFRGEERIKFVRPTGSVSYLDIYDYTFRLSHGHGIRYQGGIGGLLIPAYKWIARENRARQAYCDIFGHHHTCLDGGHALSNGSLIGWNLWAQHNGYAFEKPQQLWLLVDRKRGKRAVDPIMFDQAA